MYCSNCGNKLDGDEKFCTNCGNEAISNVEERSTSEETQPSGDQLIASPREPYKLDSETKTRLEKIYRDTGNSSFILGVFSITLCLLRIQA